MRPARAFGLFCETPVWIGNLFSLCAMISDSVSGTRKKHREIMAVQILSQFFYAASSIALKGYSSTAQNAVAVFRNLLAMKNVKSKTLEWGLILAGVVLGAAFNNRGLLGVAILNYVGGVLYRHRGDDGRFPFQERNEGIDGPIIRNHMNQEEAFPREFQSLNFAGRALCLAGVFSWGGAFCIDFGAFFVLQSGHTCRTGGILSAEYHA